MITVKGFTFNPVQENTYILFNEQLVCGIIDPGCYFDAERKELVGFINEYKLSPNYLLNTHCHLDHVFGNQFIHDTYSLSLRLHSKEKIVLDYAPEAGRLWNLPFDPYKGPLLYIAENDIIKLGDDELKVLFTPGHSPGHVCFYCESQRFVIGGDVLFRMGIGRTDLPLGDTATLLRSIREKLFTLPDDVTVYPGHGQPTTIGFEKKNNPFLQ